ncbi:MAG: acetyl-CoA carboxylase carboxyltransferase subunit alpha [Planctomycetes bacterium]|nr:acetyl-CoA carboxylase carboxyltransferase subunit alpha [Planctomycetota bacterium]MCP4771640.1 acetyl-CoA carboxylase carboxyltransferase subunit alpha [Planctomycetota bacterium]MCP4860060.1 acetyl-CoA carboxylase carboxyltransferase subunit alpha [Planctomycetota bacterium]
MAKKKKAPLVGPAALPFEAPIDDVRSRLAELEELAQKTTHDLSEELSFYSERLQRLTDEIYADLTAWNRVQVARHPNRPLTSDYIEHLCEDWVELHGDGVFGDDRAMVTGLGTIHGHKAMVIGHRKGRDTKDRLACNFGSAHPEGYRKALRKMKLAERMGLPIVCLVNTPGAYPGVAAEERGQARAIAENIFEMFAIRVPIIVMVIGEGGSGGALGIGIGDRVGMMENSWYSVITPEGCASILWRSAEGKEKAAEALKLTGGSLLKLGIVDKVVAEPTGGAHNHSEEAVQLVGKQIDAWLTELGKLSTEELMRQRDHKFRNIAKLESEIVAAAQSHEIKAAAARKASPTEVEERSLPKSSGSAAVDSPRRGGLKAQQNPTEELK